MLYKISINFFFFLKREYKKKNSYVGVEKKAITLKKNSKKLGERITDIN